MCVNGRVNLEIKYGEPFVIPDLREFDMLLTREI
jgi:hypothetical protein